MSTSEHVTMTESDFVSKRLCTRDVMGTYTWWNFLNGDAELFRFQKSIIVPGGLALDVGCSSGRNAVPLAMLGMNVTGIDLSPDRVKLFNEQQLYVQKYGVSKEVTMCGTVADACDVDFGREKYNLVLLSELFVHFSSFSAAGQIIIKAIDALKPHGYLWIRALGRLDSDYQLKKLEAERNHSLIDKGSDHIFWVMCGCSGTMRREPLMFMCPGDLLVKLYQCGMNVTYTQTIPTRGSANVLYGENWMDLEVLMNDPSYTYMKKGLISILAQKS